MNLCILILLKSCCNNGAINNSMSLNFPLVPFAPLMDMLRKGILLMWVLYQNIEYRYKPTKLESHVFCCSWPAILQFSYTSWENLVLLSTFLIALFVSYGGKCERIWTWEAWKEVLIIHVSTSQLIRCTWYASLKCNIIVVTSLFYCSTSSTCRTGVWLIFVTIICLLRLPITENFQAFTYANHFVNRKFFFIY